MLSILTFPTVKVFAKLLEFSEKQVARKSFEALEYRGWAKKRKVKIEILSSFYGSYHYVHTGLAVLASLLVGTPTITKTLKQIHTNSNHMRSRAIGNNLVQNNLIGVSEIEISLFKSRKGSDIQGIPNLVV